MKVVRMSALSTSTLYSPGNTTGNPQGILLILTGNTTGTHRKYYW